jgi:hypothetical protein
MTTQKPHDLNALASNALKDIEHAQSRLDSLRHKQHRTIPWVRIGAALVVSGVLIFASIDGSVRRFWLGVPEQQESAEMIAALTAARLAVDSSHSTTGEWPSRVPLPALAALVDLQKPGPDYRLTAQTSRWLLTMTSTGDIERTRL